MHEQECAYVCVEPSLIECTHTYTHCVGQGRSEDTVFLGDAGKDDDDV